MHYNKSIPRHHNTVLLLLILHVTLLYKKGTLIKYVMSKQWNHFIKAAKLL